MRRLHVLFLLRLQRIFKSRRRHQKHLQVILHLQQDILLLIIDNLALHDRFLLSHTCKAFRHITLQDWRAVVPRVSLEDKRLEHFGQSYEAEPKINNRQFLLRETWNLSKRQIMGYKKQMSEITQLEHMALLTDATVVEDEIELALQSPGRWRYNSCMRCHTDSGVMISPDEKTATIQAWHNFGGEESPMDANWRAFADNEYDTVFDCFTRNAHLHQRHGGVRELWFEDTPEQLPQRVRYLLYMW
ncbi:hypothetical protein BBK36DRAFT_1138366 [Trichoderma citrinoviride]|uniref:F-box domain-containing protein n=1 Tax=Trichoderma citrinoviride TaxID=58853 RepID=A0A2T4BKV6_9HYPO|nr:hypothetical protein BBK36DRAFT_1138366 [Trichoderma citrinoviride]PTB69954.1 hypothetical protein BBK36DRAFT_1138366 [Trichoderma citrinoviride]